MSFINEFVAANPEIRELLRYKHNCTSVVLGKRTSDQMYEKIHVKIDECDTTVYFVDENGIKNGWYVIVDNIYGLFKLAVTYHNGIRHGTQYTWHNNGALWGEVSIVNNEHHGIGRWWLGNGELEEETEFSHNTVVGKKLW
jgi:antitoxin component YwqK of YwqJK toxin-antitoxin module